MKALQFAKPGEILAIDIPEPNEPGPGEALVRTHRMGVCGTDIGGYLGTMPFFSYPRIPGHELGLEVLAVGEGVTNVQVGDKCSLEPYLNDPRTRTSAMGATNCCPGVQVLGVHIDGGLRDRWICPAHKLHCGNDLSYEQLALVETLAIGLHAVQRGTPMKGESVLVIGAGPIGLACLEFLKLMDVNTIAMDLDNSRLEFCRQHLNIQHTIQSQEDGSHLTALEKCTDGQLADLVIDATGSARSMSTCFDFAAFTGRVVYVGITTGNITFPHAPVFHRRELTLLASRNALPGDFNSIIQWIAEGKVNTDPWISQRLAFDDVPQRFQELTKASNGTIKTIIEVS